MHQTLLSEPKRDPHGSLDILWQVLELSAGGANPHDRLWADRLTHDYIICGLDWQWYQPPPLDDGFFTDNVSRVNAAR